MNPLPNLPRALLVRRMRAAAPELYTALRDWVALHETALSDPFDAMPGVAQASRLTAAASVAQRARAALALVEGPADGR